MNETSAPKINITGTGISQVNLEDTLQLFDQWIGSGQKKRVCVTPVNCLVWAGSDFSLQELYNEADVTLCDGVPIVWASRLLGAPLKARVTGLDLLPACVEHAHRKGHSMFFLGAGEGVAAQLKKKYEASYPGIQIKGVYCPPFAKKFSDQENEKMVTLINAVQPDILWVSLTAPKQDTWIAEHLPQLSVHIAIGVGAAFDVEAGLMPRAPVFMRENGLEWLFRLYREPKRLFRRYLLEAPRFIPMVFKQWFQQATHKA